MFENETGRGDKPVVRKWGEAGLAIAGIGLAAFAFNSGTNLVKQVEARLQRQKAAEDGLQLIDIEALRWASETDPHRKSELGRELGRMCEKFRREFPVQQQQDGK
jgi:hypothetical protein